MESNTESGQIYKFFSMFAAAVVSNMYWGSVCQRGQDVQLLQIFPSDVMHFNMQAVVSLAVFTALNSCRRYKRIFLEVGKYIYMYVPRIYM